MYPFSNIIPILFQYYPNIFQILSKSYPNMSKYVQKSKLAEDPQEQQHSNF